MNCPLPHTYPPAVRRKERQLHRGFTILELLITVFIIALLAALSLSAFSAARQWAWKAQCASNLHQLGVAFHLYATDNNGYFPRYETAGDNGTRTWWFGEETTPQNTPEGQRMLNETQGRLYRYIQQVGTIQICPAFQYSSPYWKPKYTTTSWGYG